MPISVNENGVVKPLGSNILYERQIRHIPWHTTYQALTGNNCVVGNTDLFHTITLSFVPDYVFVKKPQKNAIFWQEDISGLGGIQDNWWFSGTSTSTCFYYYVILTQVHTHHNMETENGSFTFIYDISNQGSDYAVVYTAFELDGNTVKCYFRITSAMVNTAPKITNGVGFGYIKANNMSLRALEFEVEAFGNCRSVAV